MRLVPGHGANLESDAAAILRAEELSLEEMEKIKI
jgi:hypothetical protein